MLRDTMEKIGTGTEDPYASYSIAEIYPKTQDRALETDRQLTQLHPKTLPISRQSSSSTMSVGRATCFTIIDSSSQNNSDEKQCIPSKGENCAAAGGNDHLRTHPLAWVALFFLVVLRAGVSIFQNTFSPIPKLVAEYLGVSLSNVNWLFNIQAVVYIVISFITGWLYERIGTKRSLILAGLITAIGCWIRWFAVLIHPPSFPIVMLGQIISSIGNPLTLNIMTKFATVWFPEHRRATAGMFVASNYGGMVSMFLMPSVATGKDKIEMTIIMVAGICTGAVIPQFLLPAKPPIPVSYEPERIDIGSPTAAVFFQNTWTLIKNFQFLILLGIHGINIGLSIAWGALLNQAITPYGYTDSQAGNMVAVAMAAGAIGALTAGPMLDSTKRHTLFLKLMAPFMCSTYIAMIFIIKRDSFAAIMYVNALNNFFLSFMVPVVVELGVEVSYPIPESVSTSLLWQVAQVVGFILVLILDKFRDPNGHPSENMFRGLVFQAVMASITVVLSLMYRGPMLRTEAAKEREEQRALES
ncbi:major facilitator superfamily domain-containing protein [Dichotomocladium elegans]|nr:major facilitator superfamily domain-containing protein [Dichotomocladium elegans]